MNLEELIYFLIEFVNINFCNTLTSRKKFERSYEWEWNSMHFFYVEDDAILQGLHFNWSDPEPIGRKVSGSLLLQVMIFEGLARAKYLRYGKGLDFDTIPFGNRDALLCYELTTRGKELFNFLII